ncbi:hypothetical protein [uncultured Methylibium sp.]|uniref:hypothetical protein n=1 Tax=uncultured Methylibium sp. TaxID=381093 RepID=UPI0025D052BD|nr:hypothetical protein [uncultured Methylibium sp.]
MNLARRILSPCLPVLAPVLMAAVIPAQAADPSQYSRAETLVFADRHLVDLKSPSSLRYSFVRSGSLESGFEDQVRIDVRRNGKVCCTVQGDFLTGERRLALPEIPEAEANPVILYFLERDIREMQRLTKGRPNYFQKRIRMTMVDEAQVRDTTITFQGRELPAQEVTLSPYAKDPARSRYERFADKRYTFVLARNVPGGVYQLRTALPGALPSDPPALEEVMTLTGVEAGPAPKPSKK